MKIDFYTVRNLDKELELVYSVGNAKQALVLAYLQYEMRNWNTWEYDRYEEKLLADIKENKFTYNLGRYFVRK